MKSHHCQTKKSQ